jgi:hypothetical protein
MIKNLLFILLLFFTLVGFSQITEKYSAIETSKQEVFGETLNEVTSYPNPFTVKTKITFYSTIKQNVFFEVKTILGKSVYKQAFTAQLGENEFNFQRNELLAGMYLYTLQTDNEVISKRLIMK